MNKKTHSACFKPLMKKDRSLLVQICSNSQNYTQQNNINTEIPTRSQLEENRTCIRSSQNFRTWHSEAYAYLNLKKL